MLSDFFKKLLGGAKVPPSSMETSSAEDAEALKMRILDLAKPAVALELDRSAPVRDDPHSSLGGPPSLPGREHWPISDDKPMLFIAQINYAEMPPLDGYPTKGLLSIFVEEADIFGCGFPSRHQTGFVTRYVEDPSSLVRVPVPSTPEFDMYTNGLRQRGAPMTGTLSRGLPSSTLPEISRKTYDLTMEDGDRISMWLADNRPSALYYGGHPQFVQDDPRPRGAEQTEVLLQQGFLIEDRQSIICWGDAGEATFLISPEALSQRAFERSIYTWDCS